MKYIFILFFIFCFSIQLLFARQTIHKNLLTEKSRTIFGAHGRIVDDNSVPEVLKKAASSAGILLRKRALHWNDTTKTYDLSIQDPFTSHFDPFQRPDAPTPSSPVPVCPDQNFAPGKIWRLDDSFCSAFLVSPNIMISAGHCFKVFNIKCEDIAIIMDWKRTSAVMYSGKVKEDPKNVYWCKKLEATFIYPTASSMYASEANPHIDYAVIQLDRDVIDFSFVDVHPPSEKATLNLGLATFAYPTGLTEMYDPDGVVTQIFNHDKNFRSTTDGEQGASGGLVVNRSTGKAIGIITEGYPGWEERNVNGVISSSIRYSKCWYRVSYPCDDIRNTRTCPPDKHASHTTIRQFYSKIDPNPIEFRYTLSAGSEKASSCRVKALQKLLSYSSVTGNWDTSFSEFILEKMRALRKPDGKGVLLDTRLFPEGYSGEFSYSNGVYSPKNNCPNARGSILALRELLRNGYGTSSEYRSTLGSLSLEGDSIDSSLASALRTLLSTLGYPNSFYELTMGVWRHLWSPLNERCIPNSS